MRAETANELRIGNKLQRTDGQKLTVKRIESASPDVLVEEATGLFTFGYTANPIPLTEEWLIKFGFEDCKDPEFDKWAQAKMYYKGFLQIGAYRVDDDQRGYIVKNPAFINGNPIAAGYTEFVHQLQNLFYSLVGSELSIKETV